MSRWVRLKAKVAIGRKPYLPGDWAYIGSQFAEQLIGEGRADYGPELREEVGGDAGVVYVAYGGLAVSEARNSILSVRGFHPDLPVAIVSDEDPLINGVAFLHHEDEDPGARAAKLAVCELTPFERTLYLDADTVVVSSLGGGFGLLERFDMALACDLTGADKGVLAGLDTYYDEEREATRRELPSPFVTQYACGMIFFRRNDSVASFFKVWREEWERWRWRDQGAFLRAIHRSPVRHVALPTEWNVSGQRREAMVVHHRWGAARRPGQ